MRKMILIIVTWTPAPGLKTIRTTDGNTRILLSPTPKICLTSYKATTVASPITPSIRLAVKALSHPSLSFSICYCYYPSIHNFCVQHMFCNSKEEEQDISHRRISYRAWTGQLLPRCSQDERQAGRCKCNCDRDKITCDDQPL